MGFETRAERTYFKIKKNKDSKEKKHIAIGKEGNEQFFTEYKGILKGIVYSEKTVPWQKAIYKSYNVVFQDASTQEEAVWDCKYSASIFVSFINSLCSLDEFSGELTLRPYLSTYKGQEQLRLAMEYNSVKLDWKYKPEEMPEIKPMMLRGKQAVDTEGNLMWDKEERLDWVKERVAEVNAKLKSPTEIRNWEPEVEDNDAEIDAIFGEAKAV